MFLLFLSDFFALHKQIFSLHTGSFLFQTPLSLSEAVFLLLQAVSFRHLIPALFVQAVFYLLRVLFSRILEPVSHFLTLWSFPLSVSLHFLILLFFELRSACRIPVLLLLILTRSPHRLVPALFWKSWFLHRKAELLHHPVFVLHPQVSLLRPESALWHPQFPVVLLPGWSDIVCHRLSLLTLLFSFVLS